MVTKKRQKTPHYIAVNVVNYTSLFSDCRDIKTVVLLLTIL